MHCVRTRCYQVKPEAKTYYELGAAKLKFVFPRPGFLEGIKMRSQPISIMTQVHYRLPPPTNLFTMRGCCGHHL